MAELLVNLAKNSVKKVDSLKLALLVTTRNSARYFDSIIIYYFHLVN